jgi:hypothetical protein
VRLPNDLPIVSEQQIQGKAAPLALRLETPPDRGDGSSSDLFHKSWRRFNCAVETYHRVLVAFDEVGAILESQSMEGLATSQGPRGAASE